MSKRIFQRKCPRCQKTVLHKNKISCTDNKKKNLSCNSCAHIEQIPWNRGLTSEDPRVKKQIKNYRKYWKNHKKVPWNKGLTAKTDERVAKNVASTAKTLRRLHKEGKLVSPSTRPEVKEKMRKSMLARLTKNGHRIGVNPKACVLFDEINRIMGWDGQHANNRGEFQIIGYSVDYYEPKLNIVIEYDEEYHTYPKYAKKDKRRQRQMIKVLNCKFFRISEGQEHLWQKIVKF